MCMMGLFVLMWVLKTEGSQGATSAQLSEREIQQLIGIREAFGWVPNPSSNDPIDQAAIKLRAIAPRGGDGEEGTVIQEQEGADGTDHEVMRIRQGDESTVGTPVRFLRGSRELTDSGRRQLDQIANMIRGHRQVFVVKGHVSLDDLEDGASEADRMQLSLDRAKSVADYLISRGVSPDTIRLQGASAHEPVVQRALRGDGQAANRRVEVEASNVLVIQRQSR